MNKNSVILLLGCIASLHSMEPSNSDHVIVFKSFIKALFDNDDILTGEIEFKTSEKTSSMPCLTFFKPDRVRCLYLPVHLARDMFSTIQMLQKIKTHPKEGINELNYIHQQAYLFPLLAQILKSTYITPDLPEELLPSLALLKYAYTDEQELLSLTGVIAAILDDPENEYHAYFKELSDIFLTNNLQKLNDAQKKYPVAPKKKLRLRTKEEYKEHVLYTAGKHLSDMNRIIASLSISSQQTEESNATMLHKQRTNALAIHTYEIGFYDYYREGSQ